MSSAPDQIVFKLYRRFWFAEEPLERFWNNQDNGSTLKVVVLPEGPAPTITVHNLPPKRLFVLSFASDEKSAVTSVKVDGDLIAGGGIRRAYYPKQPLSWRNTLIFAVVVFGAVLAELIYVNWFLKK